LSFAPGSQTFEGVENGAVLAETGRQRLWYNRRIEICPEKIEAEKFLMDEIRAWSQLFDVLALISIIFLTGAAFQRLKTVEDFVKNHKVFHEKVIQLEVARIELERELGKLNGEFERFRDKCDEKHRGTGVR